MATSKLRGFEFTSFRLPAVPEPAFFGNPLDSRKILVTPGFVATQPEPARRLPAWVLELRSDRRANVALAADVADAVLALTDADVPARVRRRLTAIIERAEQTGQGGPVSVAARVLAVTEPTAAVVDRAGGVEGRTRVAAFGCDAEVAG